LKLIYDRQLVGQSVLVSGANLGPVIIFFLDIFFRQLRLCYFVAPSLSRGRGCNLLLQLLLDLARAVTLGSKSRRTHGHMLLSHLRLPQPEGPGSRIYIPPNRVAQLYPRAHGSLFVSSYDSQRLRWKYSNPPPHGISSNSNFHVIGIYVFIAARRNISIFTVGCNIEISIIAASIACMIS
jgi:hypothetical protein